MREPSRSSVLLTAGEAAALLGVKLSTVYAYSHRGELRSWREGRRLLFDPAEVDDLAARRAAGRRWRGASEAGGEGEGGAARPRPENRGVLEATLWRTLLEPLVLLLLRDSRTHGYELRSRLRDAGLCTIDPGSLYRELRRMERDRLVRTSWEQGFRGPARRSYSITPRGRRRLELWIELLERGPVNKLLRHARRRPRGGRARGASSGDATDQVRIRPQ